MVHHFAQEDEITIDELVGRDVELHNRSNALLVVDSLKNVTSTTNRDLAEMVKWHSEALTYEIDSEKSALLRLQRSARYLAADLAEHAQVDAESALITTDDQKMKIAAYDLLGIAYTDLKIFPKALRVLTTALNLKEGEDGCDFTYLHLGRWHIHMEQYDEALRMLHYANHYGECSPNLEAFRGQAHQYCGRAATAMRYYKRALRKVEDKPLNERTRSDYRAAIRAEKGLRRSDPNLPQEFTFEALERGMVTHRFLRQGI